MALPQPRDLTRRDLRAANIGERYFDADLASVVPEEFRRDLATYIRVLDEARSYGYGLYIQGPNSCGKTYGLSVVLKAALQFRYSCLMATPLEIKAIQAGDMQTMQTVGAPNLLADVDFLGIDDFCKEQFQSVVAKQTRAGSFAETMLEELLRQRAKDRLPTLYTSNVPVAKLQEIYGSTVVNLMAESSQIILVRGDVNMRAREHQALQQWFQGHRDDTR